MHEYSLMEKVIESILEHMPKEKLMGSVAEVVLTVGVLEVHSEAAGRLAFEVLAKGTALENSRLRLIITPAMITCGACGYFAPHELDHDAGHHHLLPGVACPRCGAPAGLTGGAGVESIELVLTE